MRTKRLLYFCGILAIIIGILLMLKDKPQEEKTIWEEIPPNEAISNIITEEGKAKNISEHEDDSQEPQGDSEPSEDPGGEQQRDEGSSREDGKAAGLSENDRKLLLRIAQSEAGNQGPDGMWLVMSVVMNRVKSDEWPDTIREVINQTGQFSPISDGRFNKVEISEDAYEALARIEAGDIAQSIIAFEVQGSEVLDQYFAMAFDYKDHKFYTRK
jgi:N-acetylmuramoyl-L-alanine amidase